MMRQKFFILTTSILMIQYSLGSICNIPKECKMVYQKKRQIKIIDKIIKCSLESGSQIRFLKPKDSKESCKISNTTHIDNFLIRSKYQGSSKLEKGMIDLKDLSVVMKDYRILQLQYFKGFDLNLFEESIDILNFILYLEFNDFDFFLGEKKLVSCENFIVATNFSYNPRSILQFSYIIALKFYLTEMKNKICPLVFKNVKINNMYIYGENSFYSKRLLSFSNESFQNLNSSIMRLTLFVSNIELDTSFLHPDVFRSLKSIQIFGKVKKIYPNLLNKLAYFRVISIQVEYLKSVMHESGMKWLRDFNRDIDWDMENMTQLYQYSERIISVAFDCIAYSHLLIDLFPEEDFCLYKDFPINQLVMIIQVCQKMDLFKYAFDHKIPCTYLWITRSYKGFAKISKLIAIQYLLNTSDYKLIDKCNFEQKLDLCNKSNFVPKHISTVVEYQIAVDITEGLVGILSKCISVFGIITNLFVIINISSKVNKEDFKGFKQYDYLRLNSICNCLILLIHLISWLNECIYPFQVFCPIIRKTVFMQWFKIIVEEALMTALKFMNNFTYVGFAFNRISLIGKDHNKLVKFMCDLGIKKYIAFSLFISIGLSVIKVFEYDINPGLPNYSYPISYDYISSFVLEKISHFFIFNFISDLLNHVIFLLINLAIDIGMIVKLQQTLKERLEKAKEYSTKAQLETKEKESENAFSNARSMVICNTSLNLILKLPSSLYSLFYLYFHFAKSYMNTAISNSNHLLSKYIFFDVCIDAHVCEMFIKLSDFLYLLCISIQLFFYKHFDKKFDQCLKRILDKKAKAK